MNLLHLFIYFLFLTSSALSYKLEEDKCYFQLYPSEDKDKPYQFHFFNLNSESINGGMNLFEFLSTIKN